MKFLKDAAILLIGIPLLASSGIASTQGTVEQSATQSIARSMEGYRAYTGKGLPRNWEELGSVLLLDNLNKNLEGLQSYPLQDHYEFITQPMPVEGFEGSQVLLLRTVPLVEPEDLGAGIDRQFRYAVWMAKDGRIQSAIFKEEKVQRMLATSGVKIVPKPGLPAVENARLRAGETSTGSAHPDPASSAATPSIPSRPDAVSIESTEPSAEKPLPTLLIIAGAAALILASIFLLRRRR